MSEIQEKIDVDKCKLILSEFLQSKSSYDYGYKVNCVGVAAFKNELEIFRQKNNVQAPSFFVYFEHIKTVKKLINYLVEINALKGIAVVNRISVIEELGECTLNLILKNNIVGENKYFNAILMNIQKIIDDEKKLIEELLVEIHGEL